jgi:hypothetical protein
MMENLRQHTYLNKSKVQFVDVCLLLSESDFVRGNLYSDPNNKISDAYRYDRSCERMV